MTTERFKLIPEAHFLLVRDGTILLLRRSNLVDYVAAWFQQGPRDEFMARLLISELVRTARTPGVRTTGGFPSGLRTMLGYVQDHLDQPVDISELAGANTTRNPKNSTRRVRLEPCRNAARQQLSSSFIPARSDHRLGIATSSGPVDRAAPSSHRIIEDDKPG